MAITDFATWKTKIDAPSQVFPLAIGWGTANAANGSINSGWIFNGASTPSTAVACSSVSDGALGVKEGRGVVNAATSLRAVRMFQNSAGSSLMLIDRLSHQGGLSGTATGEQTTNLPTAALTRYTSGVGVWAALQIWSSVGTSGATATVSYTGAALGAGQTSPAVNFGITGYYIASRLIVLPLAAGDTGFKSVESVTLSGSTGTVGNFGVVLFKPLIIFPQHHGQQQQPNDVDTFLGCGGQVPEIADDACLELVVHPNLNTPTYTQGAIMFAED